MGRFLVIPEPNQQVRSNTNPFPAKKQLHQIICCYQHQHGKGKQAEIGHKAGNRRIMVHVANRIDMHTRRYAGHHNQHDSCQRVKSERPMRLKVTRSYPSGHFDNDLLAAKGNRTKGKTRQNKGQTHARDTDGDGRTIQLAQRQQACRNRAKQRQKDNCFIEHLLSQPFITLISSTAIEPRLRK